ncbi:MAG: histidine kinase [Betaproteobacteria bacterium]|nr:histidine kinase [Betaproteobacteria bacterium]
MLPSDRLAACRSLPRNGLYALIFNTAIAALLAAIGFGGDFLVNLVYSQCIGLPAWFLIEAARNLLWPNQRPQPLTFIPLVIASLAIATYGGTWIGARLLGHPWNLQTPLASLLISATAGFIAVLYFWERGHSEMVERQAAEARLKLLQAQIEPHFLFNTLANLDALIGADPARARTMLGHLNDYLRATLASARKERNTLGDEFALLAGYLEVIGVRMGPRLAFSLDLPESLERCEVPPMLLQPLVENAIRHGLEPKIDGGRIEVRARGDDGRLVITITDTGIGLGNSRSQGTGLGIAHVRERIAAAYGVSATLEVRPGGSGGAELVLGIPQERK